MKIFQVNKCDIEGGAARAAYRIHCALRVAGIDSAMVVDRAVSGDRTVSGPGSRWRAKLIAAREYLGQLPCRFLHSANPVLHSPSILSSRRAAALNRSEADLLHLHWLNGEMFSIGEIGKLRKPLVWTLHDMWAFCGAEHYTEDQRWREGYRRENRPGHESGFDLNRWVWNRKSRHWRRPMQIVTPSSWLASCVRESALMQGWPVRVIPNALDTEAWKPVDKRLARGLLDLPEDGPILLFGAVGGGRDPRKGFDLLLAAMHCLRGEVPASGWWCSGSFPRGSPVTSVSRSTIRGMSMTT